MAYQEQDDGSERVCADMFVDFHVLEGEMMKFSAAPSQSYGDGPDDRSASATGPEIAARLVKEGQAPQSVADKYAKLFHYQEQFFEMRSCLDGVSGQTLHGMLRHIKTTQDNLSIPGKTSAEWVRSRQPLNIEAENIAALALLMDGALSPLPLTMDHKNFFDASAASTLDFAVRIMLPDIQMQKWHLRERKSIAAAVGRTYSEGGLWDEDGNLVAVANQSCILRPRAPKKAKM